MWKIYLNFMYKAGIPLSYIKDFLGHFSIDSTTIYARSLQ